jgi:hypothetical protein
LDTGFFAGADAGGVFGRAEIENEFGTYYEETDLGLVVVQVFFLGVIDAVIVGCRGEVGLGMDFGESPGFAAVVGEGQVGAVLVGMFVVAAGDYSVSRVAESYGEDSGGVGAVDYGSVEDLPGLATVGGVEDSGGATAGGEPDVGVWG